MSKRSATPSTIPATIHPHGVELEVEVVAGAAELVVVTGVVVMVAGVEVVVSGAVVAVAGVVVVTGPVVVVGGVVVVGEVVVTGATVVVVDGLTFPFEVVETPGKVVVVVGSNEDPLLPHAAATTLRSTSAVTTTDRRGLPILLGRVAIVVKAVSPTRLTVSVGGL